MQTRSLTKVAMLYGVYYGLATVVITLVFYLIGAEMQSTLPTVLNYLAMVACMYFGVKSYRDQDLGGAISYSRSVLTSIMITVFGAVIITSFTIILYTLIDPSLPGKMQATIQQQLIEQGLPDEQVEEALSRMQMMFSPVGLFVTGVLGAAMIGFIISLIVSIFTRKEANPFQNNLS